MTSTGQYIIAWDFAKVKKGQMDKYEIKKSVLFFTLFHLLVYNHHSDHRLYSLAFTGTKTS